VLRFSCTGLTLDETLQEAQSKYEVELETDSGISLDPVTGTIGPDGTATIHFKRDANATSQGATRVSCKVWHKVLSIDHC
jgi:hypothetical protein